METEQKNIVNDAILKNIHDAVRGLGTGVVMIRVKASKIVSIETTQQQNFEDIWIEEGGGI